jgi:hypothetical protein
MADTILSFLLRNQLPFFLYLQPHEVNGMQCVCKEAQETLYDDRIWNSLLLQSRQNLRIWPHATSVSVTRREPNRILSIDLKMFADRTYWRLCQMVLSAR